MARIHRLLGDFKGLFYLGGDKIARLFSEVLIGGYVAEYLSPDGFGVWQYSFSITVILGALSSAGLTNTLVIRELNNHAGIENRIISASIYSKGLFGILSCIILLVFASWNYGISSIYFTLIFLFSLRLIVSSLDPIDFLFQSKSEAYKPVRLKIFITIIFALIKLILVKFESDIVGFGVLYVIEIFLYYGGLYFIGVKMLNFRVGQFELKLVKSMVHRGMPLLITATLIVFYFRIDQIMLKWYLNEEMVGIYSAAARISEIWYAIPTILITVLLPKLLTAKNNSTNELFKISIKIYILLTFIALFCSVCIYFFSNTIIETIYGNDFKSSAEILEVHIFSSVFVFISIYNTTFLVIENLTKYLVFISLSNALTNILFNIVLIPLYGAIGSAYSILLAYLVSIFIFCYILYIKRKDEVRTIRLWTIFKP